MSTEDLFGFLHFIDSITDMDLRTTIKPQLLRRRAQFFQNYSDQDFFKRYRMTKHTVLFILDQINEELEFDSDRNGSVAPVEQLLIALRFYGTGTHLQIIADDHGVSVPTASRVVKKVSKAIVKLQPKYIQMPSSAEEIDHCQREFFDIAKFPFVIGCIGCTHIKIQSPGKDHNGKIFRNRKGYFSVNLQTVCDAKLKVRYVAHGPGSTHEAAIYINSQLHRDFEMGIYGGSCLLADSQFPLKVQILIQFRTDLVINYRLDTMRRHPKVRIEGLERGEVIFLNCHYLRYLLTPYLYPNTVPQEQYNHSQIMTRNTVERLHEVLKRRFPALAVGLRINLQTAVDLIVSCCILHNICIDKGEDLPPNEMDISYADTNIQNEQIDHNHHDQNYGYDDGRTIITHNFFS